MNLGVIYDTVLAELGKDTYGGLISVDVFNLAVDKVNLDLTEQYIQVVGQNQNITDDVRQFVETLGDSESMPLELDSYGYSVLPDDYVRFISAKYTQFYNNNCTSAAKERPIEMLEYAHFQQRLRAGMYAPSLKRPIATIQNEKLFVRPLGIPNVEFTYFRTPSTPFYDFDIVTATNQPVYLPPDTVHGSIAGTTVQSGFVAGDPSLSVEFEWDTPLETTIVNALTSWFRMNIKDNQPPVDYKLNPPPLA